MGDKPANSQFTDLSDDELVEIAQKRGAEGEKIPAEAWEAWVVLYLRYNNVILNAIFRYLGSPQLESVAIDLTGDTFTKAFDALPNKKKSSPFIRWLRTIARNETWKWFKKRTSSLQGHMERQASNHLPEEDQDWVPLASGPLNQPADIELRESIELAKNTLSDKERQVFVLYYEMGCEVEEIARMLDKKPQTVRQALWRATTRFKSFYEGSLPSTQEKRKKASDGFPPSGETQPQPMPFQEKEDRRQYG